MRVYIYIYIYIYSINIVFVSVEAVVVECLLWLILFSGKSGSKVFNDFNDAAEEMKGKATVCSVDCR